MNYHTTFPQGGEQAEVLKEKLTPRAIVAALNEHIVGQDDAKKAVVIATGSRVKGLPQAGLELNKTTVLSSDEVLVLEKAATLGGTSFSQGVSGLASGL